MGNRTENLIALRPIVPNAQVHEDTKSEERFQNLTLRPILKLQNDLILAVYKNYLKKRKSTFYELKLPARMDYLTKSIQKDMKLRNQLKGMIIGQFTLEEFALYKENSSALNKRMMHMVIERLKDQEQLLW